MYTLSISLWELMISTNRIHALLIFLLFGHCPGAPLHHLTSASICGLPTHPLRGQPAFAHFPTPDPNHLSSSPTRDARLARSSSQPTLPCVGSISILSLAPVDGSLVASLLITDVADV